MEQRQNEVRDMMQRDYPDFYRISTLLVAVVLMILIGVAFITDKQAYGINLWTSIVTVALTYLVLDHLVKRHETRLADAQIRAQLVIQVRNRGNDPAEVALNMLRHHGWLYDGSMAGAYLGPLEWADLSLIEAQLPGVILSDAQLPRARLEYISLYGAWMERINLQAAQLLSADLQYAILRYADLQFADLRHSCLRSADLSHSNLFQANFSGADLRSASLFLVANFRYIVYDEKTIWPNGESYDYPNADVARFVIPEHPQFWEPDWAKKAHHPVSNFSTPKS